MLVDKYRLSGDIFRVGYSPLLIIYKVPCSIIRRATVISAPCIAAEQAANPYFCG
jgi:hypothetical protein